MKRNSCEYDFVGGVSDTNAEGLLKTVPQFAVDAVAWIKRAIRTWPDSAGKTEVLSSSNLKVGRCIGEVLPLHFHSIKDHSAFEVSEVAESSRPEIIALDAIVFYFQSTFTFPSWTANGQPSVQTKPASKPA
jgi:hypothetical protein